MESAFDFDAARIDLHTIRLSLLNVSPTEKPAPQKGLSRGNDCPNGLIEKLADRSENGFLEPLTPAGGRDLVEGDYLS